jgi:biopolymer transport protein TolR
MGMSLGGNSGMRAEINVTPMVDVLLVLIIIFLVITPTISTGRDTAIPQPAPDDHARAAPPPRDIVIGISKNHEYTINQEPVALAALEPRLRSLRNLASIGVIFVRGDRELEFHDVIGVIDMAKGAGWDRIGLMTQ